MRFCAEPGCPERVPRGRCRTHARQSKRYAQRFQRGATAYNTARWLSFTKAYKAAHPFCVNAGKDPRCTLVTEVTDHVTPHRGDEAAFWSGPFQPMCWACHSRKTATEL